MRLLPIAGYTAAGATMVAAMLTPFLLYGLFSNGFIALGLHVDEMYSGGAKERTIQRATYSIDVHRAVYPRLLQREKPFVQLDWSPASALPGHVSDQVDMDGDGRPDICVSFDVPRDAKAPLRVDVDSLDGRYEGMRDVGKGSFSRLIVRVDDKILVRVPAPAKAQMAAVGR
jgi:hypothetical protein